MILCGCELRLQQTAVGNAAMPAEPQRQRPSLTLMKVVVDDKSDSMRCGSSVS